jgi:hypothetical protein
MAHQILSAAGKPLPRAPGEQRFKNTRKAILMYINRRAIYTVAKHADGRLYILKEEDDLSRPERHRTWWPLGISALDFALAGYPSEWIGLRVLPYESASFDLYHPRTGEWLKRLYIAGGPSAYATYHERVPIPPPILTGKCREMEIAWQDGRWRKYSLRQGKWLLCSQAELKRGRQAEEQGGRDAQ